MKNYRIKLNEYQMNIFNKQDFNGDKQCKLQSLLAYIIKHSIDNTLTKSTNKLYAMYIRHHKSISLSYFKKLVNVLIDLKLLIRKGKQLIILQEEQQCNDIEVAKKVAKKVAKENCQSDVENTDFEEDFYLHNYKHEYIYNNYNIYNTTSEKFCASENDTFASIEQLKSIANDLYKNLKIRSNHVKTEVLNVIYAYEGRIYLKAARQYLKAVILDKKVARDKEREEFAKKYIFAKNIARVNQPVVGDTFGNYTSNNRKRLAQMETRRQYKGIEDIKQFENIGTDWQNDDWCM